MQKLLIVFVLLLTVLINHTVDAQQLKHRGRFNTEYSPAVKLQKAVLDPLPAGTYTIGSGGNFETIQDAFNKLSFEGITGPVTLELIDTMYVAPTDTFGFKLNGPIPGAGENCRVTIKPAINKNVQVQGNCISVLAFFNTSYITIDGSNITGATTLTFHSSVNNSYIWNDCIDFFNNSDHNVIQNTIFISDDIAKYGSGIGFWTLTGNSTTPDSNQVKNNFFRKGHYGVYISTYNTLNSNHRATGNLIKENLIGSESDSLINCGIQLENCKGTIVENNIVQNLKYTSPSTMDVINYGINSFLGNGDTIRNNVVHNIKSNAGYTSTGILLSGTSNYKGNDDIVYNNMVYDIQSTSTESNSRVTGIQMWNQNNPKIYYNSVYLSGIGTNNYGSAALYIDYCTNVGVKNNIFVNTRDESPYCASAIYDYTISNLTSDYNDLYYDDTNQNNCLIKIGSVNYNTLSDWQAAGKDSNSITEIPKFVASDNLHINSLVPTNIESHGTPISQIETDFDGDVRNSNTPDIGADEFDGTVVNVEKEDIFPKEFALEQNYPNPFNPSTTIQYSIPRLSKVKITLFSLLGEKIKTLVDEEKMQGNYEIDFNASDLPSGVYFYQLKAGDFIQTRKMILLK